MILWIFFLKGKKKLKVNESNSDYSYNKLSFNIYGISASLVKSNEDNDFKNKLEILFKDSCEIKILKDYLRNELFVAKIFYKDEILKNSVYKKLKDYFEIKYKNYVININKFENNLCIGKIEQK